MNTAELEFYIVPTRVLNTWLVADFEECVRTPGRGGRPHDPTTRQTHLSFRKRKESLAPYRGAWGLSLGLTEGRLTKRLLLSRKGLRGPDHSACTSRSGQAF